MVVRLTPASLDDGMPMDEWQRRRKLQLAGLTGLAHPDSGLARGALSDDMPMPAWQRTRAMQAGGGDVISGGGGEDSLAGGAGRDTLGAATARPTLRPGQIGLARQVEFDGDIAAGQALGGLASAAQRVVGSLFGGSELQRQAKPAATPKAPPLPRTKRDEARDGGAHWILDEVSKAEGTAGDAGYDMVFKGPKG